MNSLRPRRRRAAILQPLRIELPDRDRDGLHRRAQLLPRRRSRPSAARRFRERKSKGFLSRERALKHGRYGAGAPLPNYFFAWPAFCFAQRRFCAAAIRARASALSTRFFLGRFPKEGAANRDPSLLCSSARTFSRRLISSSIAAINSSRDIGFLFSLDFLLSTTYRGTN